MSCPADIKRAVLRGVYEDNVGIRRSSVGNGRSRAAAVTPAPAPEVNTSAAPRSHGMRRFLMFALTILAVLSVDVRLSMTGGADPVVTANEAMHSAPVPDTAAATAALGAALLRDLSLPADIWELQRLDPGPELTTGFDASLLRDITLPDDYAALPEAPRAASPGQASAADAGGLPAVFEPGAGTAAPMATRYDALLSLIDTPMADLFGLKIHTIVIDPGHGGRDPGATGPTGLKEKDVTLDIARRLRDKLASSGRYRVLLTRDADEKVFLKERVAFAKANNADLFISIHANSLPDESVNYVETYYFGPHTDQQALTLSEEENQESDYSMGEFREVIAKIGDTLKTEESKDLATSIHRQLYRDMKRRNDQLVNAGAKTGPFVVLLGVDIPSVLVEVSCISNTAEETRLAQAEYRDSVAGFLEKGIVDYLDRRANNNAVAGGKTQHVASQER